MGANAVTSVPLYASGDVLTAANLNITNSGVPVFSTTATRDAAFGGTGEKVLAEGQMCYIEAAPKRLQVYNGTAWVDFDAEYQTWTPTWTNLTVGNGSQSFSYARIGKFVHLLGRLVFGTTTSVSGLINMSIPTTASDITDALLGNVFFFDTGVNGYWGFAQWLSTTTSIIRVGRANDTYLTYSDTSATVPFTFGNTDSFVINYWYKGA